MAKIEKLGSLIQKLTALAAKAKDANTSYVVGYTAAYAIYVHENLEAHHPVGQAKFLEQPARQLSNTGEFSKILTDTYKKTRSIEKGLLLCALRLQRESQLLCPVDTGALRASAYVQKDES